MFDLHFDSRTQTCSYGEVWFRISGKIKNNSAFPSSEYQDFDAQLIIEVFLIGFTHKSFKFSVMNSMSEMKPVVMEKHEFANQGGLFLVTVFGTFGVACFWCKDETRQLFNRMLPYKNRIFDWDFDGRNETSSCWEFWFWILR